MHRPIHLLAVALFALACGDEVTPDPSPVVEAWRTLGVPKDGFPSWEERVILVLTNRARSDPGAQSQETCGGGCVSYPASKPLSHNHDMARAARFHAASTKKAGAGLQHDSICRLVSNLASIYPGKCDGDPSCACEGGSASCSCSGGKPYCSCPGGACTSTWGRIGLFGVQGTGENAAAGSSDPIKTFGQWVKSSGHWSNINKSSHGQLGAGHYGGPGKGCFSHFWVQVFGYGSSTPRLPSGAHHPQRGGPGSTVRFWANWHDPAGAPASATVNIGGTCFPMKLERGTAHSGTYLYSHPFQAAACHRYYFVFRTKGGQRVTMPTSGSYGVDISAPGACPDHSDKLRPNLGKGCGGCVSAAECTDSDPCTKDSCVAGKCQHQKITGCCIKDAQCNDQDSCTLDGCDLKAQRCWFKKKPSCGGDGKPGPDGGVPVGVPPPDEGGDMDGGCAVARAAPAMPWPMLALLFFACRPRRLRC